VVARRLQPETISQHDSHNHRQPIVQQTLVPPTPDSPASPPRHQVAADRARQAAQPIHVHRVVPAELASTSARSQSAIGGIDEAAMVADAGLVRMGTNDQLCFNFLEHTPVFLYDKCDTCIIEPPLS
jgi:hypothetical protein